MTDLGILIIFLFLGGFLMCFLSFMMVSGCPGVMENIFFIIGIIISAILIISGIYMMNVNILSILGVI